MNKARSVTTLLLTLLVSAPSLQSQDVVLPGSTAQGDILRGQGQFLKGAAWYEINAARAREIDARTAIEQERWNREVYESYERELAAAAARKRSVRNERLADAKKRVAERQERLQKLPELVAVIGDVLGTAIVFQRPNTRLKMMGESPPRRRGLCPPIPDFSSLFRRCSLYGCDPRETGRQGDR